MTTLTPCTGIACGTGGWTGPLPGDPDNNITLSAAASFGGITVRWSYPAINSHAVAHVKVFRGSSSSFSSAVEIAIESGNTYFDEQNNTSRWYYWIRVVSVNGTVGGLIGPASAVARKLSDDLIEQLSGEIDRGILAQSLQQELDLIPFFQSELLKEIFDRETGETSLAQAIQDANNGVAQAMTFIGTVNTSRISDNQALAETLQATAAVLQNGIAAVTTEVQVQVTRLDGAITAEALQRNQVVAQLDNKYAGITSQQATAITQVDGRISSEISNRQQAITNVGNRITGVETNMNVIANEVDDIYSSMWTVRLQAGNLIGGFGLYNNSLTIEAGFDVDRFWIGKAGAVVKPFIVDGGIVYIDKARIRNADIDTLKIAGGAVTAVSVGRGGSRSIPGNGASSTLCQASVYFPVAGAPAVIVVGYFVVSATVNCSLRLVIDFDSPNSVGTFSTPLSLQGGFVQSFVIYEILPNPGVGMTNIRLQTYAETSGPASNVPFNVHWSTVTVQGAKR